MYRRIKPFFQDTDETLDIHSLPFIDIFGALSEPKTTSKLTILDALVTIVIAILSFHSRFRHIDYPNSSCFDEFLFGPWVNCYNNGTYYFDIHPPLGRLTLYWGGKLLNYNSSLYYEAPGHNIPYETNDYVKLRSVNGFFSSLVAPLLYLALRLFSIGVLPAFSAGMFPIFDDIMIIEGTHIFTDGIMHFYVALTLFASGLFSRQTPGTLSYKISVVFCVIIGSMAMCTKQVVLFVLPLTFLLFLLTQYCHYPENLKDGFISFKFFKSAIVFLFFHISVFIIVTLIVYKIHFSLLYIPSHDSFNTCPMNITKNYNDPVNLEIWDKCIHTPLPKRIFIELTVTNIQNFKKTTRTENDKTWYQFPVTDDGMLTYSSDTKYMITGHFNMANNYIGFISVLAGGLVFVVVVIGGIGGETLLRKSWRMFYFICGYLASYIPLSFINRIIYLYHYIIPMLFLFSIFACLADLMPKKLGVVYCIIGVVVSGWTHYMRIPETYGDKFGFFG